MILADKIIQLRKKNGWSQEELAEQMGVSRQAVCKWEGAQSIPDINRLIQLSKLFNVSIDYLLKDEMEEITYGIDFVHDESVIEEKNSKRYVSMEEAYKLLQDLNNCENPFNCPHGRPVFVKITNYDIEKLFKRVV